MDLAYLGFIQDASVRHFRFECQIALPRPSATPRRIVDLVVSAEMSLFLRFAIPIQDGPAICQEIVAEAIAGISESELVSTSYVLRDSRMASLAAARIELAHKKLKRPHKPSFPANRSSSLTSQPEDQRRRQAGDIKSLAAS